MRINELTTEDLINYCRIYEADETVKKELDTFYRIAKKYISEYTGLDETSLDDYEDLSIACFILVSDFYDNRNYYIDYKSTVLNKSVETILNLHCKNFL